MNNNNVYNDHLDEFRAKDRDRDTKFYLNIIIHESTFMVIDIFNGNIKWTKYYTLKT